MSDLFKARGKTEQGNEWRGSITVSMDGEEIELSVRQLVDTETWDVMGKIDKDELKALETDADTSKLQELRDLEQTDDLDDDAEQRLTELREEVEDDVNLFEVLSKETFLGIKQAAKYGVEPDSEDVRDALAEHMEDIRSEYGGTGHDEAEQYLNDHVVHPMIENSVDFTSFAIGIKVLDETMGDVGN